MTNQLNSNNLKTIAYSKIVDLTHKIHPNIPIWPDDPPVQFETVAQIKTSGYFLRKFSIGEHSGTHMNAPNSFYAGGASIDNYPPQSLVLPAIAIDIRDQSLAKLTESIRDKMKVSLSTNRC